MDSTRSAVRRFSPKLDPFRREQLFSTHGGTSRIPAGLQRALVRQFVNMALSWSPLDKRVLLWTGMCN